MTLRDHEFEQACDALRPELHRFCTRMTGSPCDGEDVLHDALIVALGRIGELRDRGALRSWLFRIAHNRCVDFLRGRRRFEELDEEQAEGRDVDDALEDKRRVERALANIVTELPPRERACLILKDVLDVSLEETAEITGSTVGSVKAALHRGREKLERAEHARRVEIPASQRVVIERYLDAFNRRDWDAVQSLLADDARLEVVHRSEGPFRDACYFINYGRLTWPFRLALAYVDGIESIVHFRQIDGEWRPHAIVLLGISQGAITLVRDYIHVDYLLRHSNVATGGEPLATAAHDLE